MKDALNSLDALRQRVHIVEIPLDKLHVEILQAFAVRIRSRQTPNPGARFRQAPLQRAADKTCRSRNEIGVHTLFLAPIVFINPRRPSRSRQ